MAEKSKRNQYLLLALVAVIWGGVIYRFLAFTQPETEDLSPIRLSTASGKQEAEKTTYTYKLNYPDPFLKYTNSKTEEPKVEPNPFQFIPLPELVYLGLVASGNQKVGVLKINGKSLMVKEGETWEGIKVKELDNRFVQLKLAEPDTVLMVFNRLDQ